jgi:TPR repeat protein
LKAAAFGDSDGDNSFGCCLEQGEVVDQSIELTVHLCREAASQLHPSGLYNFGRYFECGLGIERDSVRAAKYYHKAAELGKLCAQNSFAICLKRGTGIRSNQALAAHCFELSAMQGNRDEANNLGFCLEHVRSVKKDIRSKKKRDSREPQGDE